MADFFCGLFVFFLFLFLLIKIFTDCKVCSGTGVRHVKLTSNDGKIYEIRTGDPCPTCQGTGKRKKSGIYQFWFVKLPLLLLKQKFMNDKNWNKIINEADEYMLLTKSGSNYASYLSKNYKVIVDRIFDSSRKKHSSSKEEGSQSTNGLNH